MSSGYHGGSSSFETSLPDPPAKRIAPSGDYGASRAVNDGSSGSSPGYALNSSNGASRESSSTNSSNYNFATPSRQATRDHSQQVEQVNYTYAIPSGPGVTTANSPFALLQHPAYADLAAQDRSGDQNGAYRLKQEESSHHGFAHPSGGSSSAANQISQGLDSSERTLAPTELLPPSAYSDGVPIVPQHVSYPAMGQAPLVGASYSSYGLPSQYSQFPGAVYGSAGSAASAGIGSSATGVGLSHSPSPPPNSAAHQFSMPMRKADFAGRGNMMGYPVQRRHSIAVPSPGHNFGLWVPSQLPDSHEWPSSTRSSFSMMEDSESNLGGDDGSDSDGGEGSSVMVSIRPKDMPPGGPVIEGKFITLLVGPGEHQVKDFNILPINILRINYESKSSDYIVVHLICDLKMKRATREIFMTAVSAHHLMHDNKRAVLPALKISQQMLRGRTKGFLFQLRYTLVVDGREVETLHCEPFYLWSNVSQRSFPRHEREAYAQETQDINTRKRRRR